MTPDANTANTTTDTPTITTTDANNTTDTIDHATSTSTQHVDEHPDYESLLTGVVALAALFSNCVEAFGLIHPSYKWEKGEQLLLTRLGLQQARLLIWGDVVGVSSPPANVTDRAVPKHPSAAYPDLKEPTFFNARDRRLEETHIRTQIEAALSAIVERQTHTTREEMMGKYGLKPPKKFTPQYEHALDVNRLEAFREKHELLKEVAESYAQISTRRASSITRSSWAIADVAKFDGFVKLIQAKIDELVTLMDVKERVDRGMCMDIKALGWHLSADRQRIASDVSKLRMITEVAKSEYPEWLAATEAALANIERERRENIMDYNPYASAGVVPVSTPHSSHNTQRRGSTGLVQTSDSQSNGNANATTSPATTPNGGHHHKAKHGGLLGGFFKFGRKHSGTKPSDIVPTRSQSVSAISPPLASPTEDLTPRALSDAGPAPSAPGAPSPPNNNTADTTTTADSSLAVDPALSPMRSKSVGEILDFRPETEEDRDAFIQQKLERMDTNATVEDDVREDSGEGDKAKEWKVGLESLPSRHDQFHGLGRQGTKVQFD